MNPIAELTVLKSNGTRYRTVIINVGNTEHTFVLTPNEFEQWQEAIGDDFNTES